MHVYGYLYRERFNPTDPFHNLIVNDDSCFAGQFRLKSFLDEGTVYILVVATPVAKGAGAFSIVSTGVANVILTRLGEYDFLRVFRYE